MKKIITLGTFVFTIGIMLTACKKEVELVAIPEELQSTQGLLKINYVSGYAANPAVQFKINNLRVSNLITSRTPFPGGGYNTGGGNTNDYLVVNPGSSELTVSIPNKDTNSDSVLLFKTNISLNAGERYTAHITDTADNTKIVLLQDDISKPDTSQAKFKFVNLIPNVPAVDLYYGTTLVASSIAYLNASDCFTVPTATPALAWSIKEAGGTTSLATYTSANTILNQRVYTAFALGYKGSTDAPRKPYISFLLNR